jgi:AcrR family transcriptional regulator
MAMENPFYKTIEYTAMQPRVAESRKRRAAEMLEAAAKVFARRGYHGALADYALRAQRILRGPGSASDKVASLVFQHLAPMVERLDFTLTFLRERRFLPAPARKRIRAIELRYERIIEKVIEQGIASGEFRADLDARMATLALLGLGNSAAAWYGREPDSSLDRITSSYVDLLVRAFRRGEAPTLRVRH